MRKGIFRFKGKKSQGNLHYIDYNGERVSITKSGSRKVSHIKEFGHIDIATSLVSSSFKAQRVDIYDDVKYVKSVFNHMKDQDHSHYKNWEDDFVVLKYK